MLKHFFSLTNVAGRKCAEMSVSSKIYSLETIFAVSYVFLDRSYVLLDEGRAGKVKIFLIPKKKKASGEQIKELALQFYNELANYAHYFSRVKATKGVVEKILQRALFSASPSLVEESEEREIQNLLKELEADEETKDLITGLKNEKDNPKKKK